MIRAPRMCRVPDCTGEAIGRCTVDVDWHVCWWHFPLAKNNGFAPLTWAELQERRERWSAEKSERMKAQVRQSAAEAS